MNNEYLEKNNLVQIRQSFLGHTVRRVISKDEVARAQSRGVFEMLMGGIHESFSAMFLVPTIEHLKKEVFAFSVDTSASDELEWLCGVDLSIKKLKARAESEYGDPPCEVYIFIYMHPRTYHNLIESPYLYNSGVFDPRGHKLMGVFCAVSDKIAADELLVCAIPEPMLDKEEYTPNFIQEIFDNQ